MRSILALLVVAVVISGCATLGGQAPKGAKDDAAAAADPVQVAQAWWQAVGEGDTEAFGRLSSFPLDLDANDGCIEDAASLAAKLGEQINLAEMKVEVGDAREVGSHTTDLEGHFLERLDWCALVEAKCVLPTDPEMMRCVFVEFSVNGNPVGALTRVRCDGKRCGVAGTEN